MTASVVPYPSHWEADVVLRDGSTMHIRPIRPDDADALQRFHMRQSAESRYLRFFAPIERLSEELLTRFTQIDYRTQVALVLVDGSEIIAVGRFERLNDADAEVAFNVADAAQGRGLGSVLLEHLAAAGRELGVRRFVADVLPQNSKMVRVFGDAGYDVHTRLDDGILEIAFGIASTDRSLAVLAEREQRAEARSMHALMDPSSVVLVACGREGEQIAQLLAPGLEHAGVPVHVVGPHRTGDVAGSLAEVHADLALIAAPAEVVMASLEPLAAAGVRAVVLYTGEFAVDGGGGRSTQRTLVRRLRRHGLRLVGPRSYGLIATLDAGSRLDASLHPRPPRAGSVGIFAQSAASGRALLEGARDRDLGVSSFLSAGHRVDVSGNDTMQFWVTDDATTVACLRLESIGNPRKFTRVARRLAERIPVIASIAGITGQLRPPGHEVATSDEPRSALDELMRQCGVLSTESVDEALDLAMLLAEQPLPGGARVLMLSNAGAHVAVVGELLRANGLHLVTQTRALSPTAGPQAYADQVSSAIASDEWDVALVSYVPLLRDDGEQVAREAVRLAQLGARTTVAVIDGVRGLHEQLLGEGIRVPGFATLPAATHALAQAVGYRRWLDTDHGTRVAPSGIDRAGAKRLVQHELVSVPRGSTRRLSVEQSHDLLAAYGIGLWEHRSVRSLPDALSAAEAIGWPVVLKTSEERLRHRSDLGGVRLDLSTERELTEAYHSIQDRVSALVGSEASLDVQAMAPTGVATVIRAREDRLYGPIVSFGLSGDASELLGDVSYRVPPLTDVDVSFMVSSLRTSQRLLGTGELPALHVEGLESVIARVSVLKEDLAEVASIVMRPVIVTETDVVVLGAQVDLAHPDRGDAARRVLPA